MMKQFDCYFLTSMSFYWICRPFRAPIMFMRYFVSQGVAPGYDMPPFQGFTADILAAKCR